MTYLVLLLLTPSVIFSQLACTEQVENLKKLVISRENACQELIKKAEFNEKLSVLKERHTREIQELRDEYGITEE